jgi:hypothetical protein
MSRHSERQAARPRRKKRVDLAVELRVGENGLDHAGASAVERGAGGCGKGAAHEGVEAAVPARAAAFALLGVGRDEDCQAVSGECLHLDLMPVTASSAHHVRRLLDAGGVQLAAGGVDERPELAEVGRRVGQLSGDRRGMRAVCMFNAPAASRLGWKLES